MKNADLKRLFFGAEVKAPWPKDLPSGRIITEDNRHLTLAFLGENSFEHLQNLLPSLPKPAFRLGLVGICDELIFLPKRSARVVAGHVKWLLNADLLGAFHQRLNDWLKANNYTIDARELLSHITIARAPFAETEWEEWFSPFPVILKAIHLYESVGNLHYRSLWNYQLLEPFTEEDHTADIAFHIRGENLEQVHQHAQIALAFKYPPLLNYLSELQPASLDDIVIDLNNIVACADQEIGTPFKAVSFHGDLKKDIDHIYTWEMIVDV